MLSFLGDVASVVMTPLYYVVSASLLAWREIVATAISEDSGWTWALAIVGMTVTIRVLMMPLYVWQLELRRDMRQLLPRIRALQETHPDDRERLRQEQMKLWSSAGAKPFVFWLPLILLGSLLFALFRIIDASATADGSFRRGLITEPEAQSLAQAEILGGRFADTLLDSSRAESTVFVLALIVAMCVTQVLAQRQQRAAMRMDAAMPDQVARQQRILLFALPAVLAAVGLVLPIGVLIFWATSKVWTVGQQHVLRDDPGPDPSPVE